MSKFTFGTVLVMLAAVLTPMFLYIGVAKTIAVVITVTIGTVGFLIQLSAWLDEKAKLDQLVRDCNLARAVVEDMFPTRVRK